MSDMKLRDRANAYAAEVIDRLVLPVHSVDQRLGIIRAIAAAFVTGFGAGMESEATRRLCGEPGEVLA